MAKAASTFAALRTRAAAMTAASPTSEGVPSNNASSSGQRTGAGAGVGGIGAGASSFFPSSV